MGTGVDPGLAARLVFALGLAVAAGGEFGRARPSGPTEGGARPGTGVLIPEETFSLNFCFFDACSLLETSPAASFSLATPSLERFLPALLLADPEGVDGWLPGPSFSFKAAGVEIDGLVKEEFAELVAEPI